MIQSPPLLSAFNDPCTPPPSCSQTQIPNKSLHLLNIFSFTPSLSIDSAHDSTALIATTGKMTGGHDEQTEKVQLPLSRVELPDIKPAPLCDSTQGLYYIRYFKTSTLLFPVFVIVVNNVNNTPHKISFPFSKNPHSRLALVFDSFEYVCAIGLPNISNVSLLPPLLVFFLTRISPSPLWMKK